MEPGRGAHTRSVEVPSCSFPVSPGGCLRVRETSTLVFVALSESCRSKTSESSLVLPATDRTLADLSLRCCTLEVGRDGRGLRFLAAGLGGISPTRGCGENMVNVLCRCGPRWLEDVVVLLRAIVSLRLGIELIHARD